MKDTVYVIQDGDELGFTGEVIESFKVGDGGSPYIEQHFTIVAKKLKYNPKYGDGRICKCGHSYYRHFDTYEDMAAVGCKYCGCSYFEESEK